MSKPEVPVNDILNYFAIMQSNPSNWLETIPNKKWELKKITPGFETLTISSMAGKMRIYELDDRSYLDVEKIDLDTVKVKGQVYDVHDK